MTKLYIRKMTATRNDLVNWEVSINGRQFVAQRDKIQQESEARRLACKRARTVAKNDPNLQRPKGW